MMKTNKRSSFLILAIYILSFSSLLCAAESLSDGNTSIEWQQLKLQENIEKKINRSLAPVLKEGEYVAEVKITLDKDFSVPQSSKKITKTKQGKKAKFTTEISSNSSSDAVILNKFGLEAPIYGEDEVETETSQAELSQKALIEISDHFNIFKYIKAIDINLTLDKSLPEKSREVIQTIVRGIGFNFNDIVPQINIQFLDLYAAKNKDTKDPKDLKAATMNAVSATQETDKKTTSLFHNQFKNLDIAIGMIIAATLIAVALYVNSRKTNTSDSQDETNSNNANNANNQAGANNSANNEPADKKDLASSDDQDIFDQDGNMKESEVNTKIKEGTERLRKALTHHYNETIIIIKTFIKIGKPQEAFALKAIVDVLTDSELSTVFKSLSQDERSRWKEFLVEDLTKEQTYKAFNFISSRLMETMMVPSIVDDVELFDFFLDLTPSEAAKICQDDLDLAVVLSNVLSSNVINETYKLIPPELVSSIIESSLNFKSEDLKDQIPLLKIKMATLKPKKEKPIFVNRILEILPMAKAELEEKLYRVLLTHQPVDDVKLIALKSLPHALIAELPDSVFKHVIKQMTFEDQVAYFAILPDEKRQKKLSSFAKAGTKSYEMLDMEIQALIRNELTYRKIIKERAASFEEDFFNSTRKAVAESIDFQSEIIGQVEKWLNEINDHKIEPELKTEA